MTKKQHDESIIAMKVHAQRISELVLKMQLLLIQEKSKQVKS